MSKSRIAMIDGYDLGAHLNAPSSATAAAPPAPADIQQWRFDEIKRRVQALVPINDALYDALAWYKARAAAVSVTPGVNMIAFALRAYPVAQMQYDVDQWHTSALALMKSDSWIYDVAASDTRFVEFSRLMDRKIEIASEIADRIQNGGIQQAVARFTQTFPEALAKTVRWSLDGGGKILREGFGIDLKALKPYLLGGAALLALFYIVPLLPRRRGA